MPMQPPAVRSLSRPFLPQRTQREISSQGMPTAHIYPCATHGQNLLAHCLCQLPHDQGHLSCPQSELPQLLSDMEAKAGAPSSVAAVLCLA